MACELAFVLVVEAGDLERRAALLIESIRSFAGPHANAPIWVVQPRAGRMVSAAVMECFLRHDATFVCADLNRTWKKYGYGNKAYATAFVESLVEGKVETLAFLDSDLVFMHPPDDLVLRNGEVMAARPADTRGVGLPCDEEANEYWAPVYKVCGVDPARLWDVTTTVDECRIRAYFNAGLLCAKPSLGLFRRWRDNLELMAKEEWPRRFPLGTREALHLDQAVFAATVMAHVRESQVRLLDWRYNYPFRKHGGLPPAKRAAFLDDVVALHYHKAFNDMEWTTKIEVREPMKAWLLERLPVNRPWPS
jgi:hypothetical protein